MKPGFVLKGTDKIVSPSSTASQLLPSWNAGQVALPVEGKPCSCQLPEVPLDASDGGETKQPCMFHHQVRWLGNVLSCDACLM